MSKSWALEGPTRLQELKDLCGIPIVKKVKYLGYTFSARRDQLIRDAKVNIQKHAEQIRGKVRFQNNTV